MTIPGLLALLLCVFWPVSIWYVERLLDKSDEPLGIISLIAFLAITLSRRSKNANSIKLTNFAVPISAIICIIAYIVTWPFAPKLLSAIFAVLAIGCVIGAHRGGHGHRPDLGGWLLLLFSLPIVSSLNFYSGYPLRLVVGKIAAPLISMVGFPTIADGTTLIWGQQMVQIDAPCSGIKMLWFALFIGAVLTCVLKLSLVRSAVVLAASVIASLLGNVLRITSLFFVETGILKIDQSLDSFVHQAVGTVAFAIAAGLTVVFALRLSRKETEDKTAPALEEKGEPVGKQKFLANKRLLAFLCAALIAALTPCVFTRSESAPISDGDFPGWPGQYNGLPYQPVPASKADAAFYREFPGKIQCVSQGKKRIVMRWVAKPTRQLHPSSDCFRGLGYKVSWQPLLTDSNRRRWSRFNAEKEGRTVEVTERIYDREGQSWTDISSWYWAALLGKTRGPWWSDVEIAPI